MSRPRGRCTRTPQRCTEAPRRAKLAPTLQCSVRSPRSDRATRQRVKTTCMGVGDASLRRSPPAAARFLLRRKGTARRPSDGPSRRFRHADSLRRSGGGARGSRRSLPSANKAEPLRAEACEVGEVGGSGGGRVARPAQGGEDPVHVFKGRRSPTEWTAVRRIGRRRGVHVERTPEQGDPVQPGGGGVECALFDAVPVGHRQDVGRDALGMAGGQERGRRTAPAWTKAVCPSPSAGRGRRR